MILYLHPTGKAKLLDELATETNQYLKALCTDEIESLNTFVMYSQGSFLNSNLCIFHLTPQSMNAQQKDDLLKAVRSFKCLYSARLVLILPDLQKDSELLSRVMAEDIRNLITTADEAQQLVECRVCLSDDGKEFEDTAHLFAQEKINLALEFIKPRIELPETPLKITVGGILNRIGTTTQCLAVYRYLEWLGLRCCYVDTTGRHMDSLSALYQKPIEDGSLAIEEINMKKWEPQGRGYHAHVVDYGVISDENRGAFLESDVSLLCCGTKAWELPALADLLVQSDSLMEALMLFSFTGETERAGAVALLAPITKQVFFAPYSPDIFGVRVNTDFYSSMLLNRIQAKEGESE